MGSSPTLATKISKVKGNHRLKQIGEYSPICGPLGNIPQLKKVQLFALFSEKGVDDGANFPIMDYMISSLHNPIPVYISRGNISTVFRPGYNFVLYGVRPRYDDRDAYCGDIRHRFGEYKTLGYALLEAKKLAVHYYGDNYESYDMDGIQLEIRVHPNYEQKPGKLQKKRDMWANAVIMGCESVIPF